jgi:hypothetical protein
MAAGTVRVKGLREVDRAFRKTDKESSKALRAGLLEAARPVAATARDKIGQYGGANVTAIRPRAVARGAFVTQGARKVTGLRGDFGALQMRRLGEALDENQAEVLEKAERVIDLLAEHNGL